MNQNIFIKQSELHKNENKINTKDIPNMIPNGSIKNKDFNKRENMIEFRWRLFDIKGKTFIEISKKYPGKARVYFNKYGKWVERNIEKYYSNYCVEKYYYYTHI